MSDKLFHVHFTEAQTALRCVVPSSCPWQEIGTSVPEDGTWCWGWHTAWARDMTPNLVVYREDEEGEGWWWMQEGSYIRTDQLTHWMPAQVPAPPPDKGQRSMTQSPLLPLPPGTVRLVLPALLSGVAGEDIQPGEIIGCLPGTSIYTRVALPGQTASLHSLCIAVHDAYEGSQVAGMSYASRLSGGVEFLSRPDAPLWSPGLVSPEEG